MQKTLMLVLAGVVIGVLIAPEKGASTQRKISNWLGGKTDDAGDFIRDAADNVRSKARTVKNDFLDATGNAQDEIRDAKKNWS